MEDGYGTTEDGYLNTFKCFCHTVYLGTSQLITRSTHHTKNSRDCTVLRHCDKLTVLFYLAFAEV